MAILARGDRTGKLHRRFIAFRYTAILCTSSLRDHRSSVARSISAGSLSDPGSFGLIVGGRFLPHSLWRSLSSPGKGEGGGGARQSVAVGVTHTKYVRTRKRVEEGPVRVENSNRRKRQISRTFRLYPNRYRPVSSTPCSPELVS